MKTLWFRLRSFGVCIFTLAFYLITSFWFVCSGFSAVQSALCAGVFSTAICCIFYFWDKSRAISATPHFGVSYLIFFLVVGIAVWFCSQFVSVLLHNCVGSVRFIRYQHSVAADANLYVILTLFVAPVAEEMLFRGIWFRELSKWSVSLAYIVSISLFAVLHGTLVHLPVTFLCGFVFCLVYDYSGKLRYSILLHSLFNFLSLRFNISYGGSLFFAGVTVLSYVVLFLFLVKLARYRRKF